MKPKNPGQSQRFIQAAREAGASEDEAVFDETLRRLSKAPARTKRATAKKAKSSDR